MQFGAVWLLLIKKQLLLDIQGLLFWWLDFYFIFSFLDFVS